MKPEELYELRIGARVTQKELAAHLGVDRRITEQSSSATPLLSRSSGAYVNLHKVPMTGTALAGSLILRNLIRFLGLGICRLMGKNTPKGRQYYILSAIALPKTPVHKLNLRVSKSPASLYSLCYHLRPCPNTYDAAPPLSGTTPQFEFMQ